MTETIRFDGRVAIVTGAGNGLGRDYALELAKRGARVVVNDLGGSGSGEGTSAGPAARVVEEICDTGGEAVASTSSVATREGGAEIVQTALDAFGKVDICINNAGFLRNARFEDLTDADIDAILDVHLKAGFYVGQPAYRAMRSNGYGRMLFTASASAMFGHSWQANYAAAKAGLVGLSNVVAIEGSAYGIHSNAILPTALTRLGDQMDQGFLEIPAFAKMMETTDWSATEGRLVPEFNTPLALFLVSEACAYTHGVFASNSGRYARVAIAAAEGWFAPAGAVPPSLEDVAAHFDQIVSLGDFAEPLGVYEEMTQVANVARKQGQL